MYKVYWRLFGYFSEKTFTTLEDAANYARFVSFDADIWLDNEVVATCSDVKGLRVVVFEILAQNG